MVANIKTVVFQGVDAIPVEVQGHLAPGQNAFNVGGLPDKSAAESRKRVRTALSAVGLALPYDQITINLSRADLLKEGSHYDLPIALGLLVAMGTVGQDAVIDESGVTARGFNRIWRVARSLADLAGREALADRDIATMLVWRGH